MSDNFKKKISNLFKKFNSGKKEEVFKEIENLIQKNNTNIELIISYAIIANKLNYISKSIKSFSYVLEKQPTNIICLHNLYTIHLKNGEFDKAMILIENIIKIKPQHYEALRDRAYIQYLKGEVNKAFTSIEIALKENSNDYFGMNIKGLLLFSKNKLQNAIKIFENAIRINKSYPASYNNLGNCYFELEDLNRAFLYFKKSYKLNPQFDLALINIGNVLSLKDKNIAAINFYKKALEISPKKNEVYSNIAMCFCRLKDIDNANIYYSKAILLNPKDYDLKLSFAYLLLFCKKFKPAWKLFDSRLLIPRIQKMNKTFKNVKEKLTSNKLLNPSDKILVIKEQGVGDEILFSSMYRDLLKKFPNVKIETDPRLKKIFKRSFKKNIFYSFKYFSNNLNSIKLFDKVIYAGSLTKYFRKNEKDFNGSSYLDCDQQVYSKLQLQINRISSKPKIGISWKSVVNIYGKLKSLQIDQFKPIFTDERSFINLQYGDTKDEINVFQKKGFNIFSFEEIDLFNDFESNIALLKNLDVFVTVSNSTAHIAGAIGVPTIVICPKKASTFYYWDYENNLTPWYDSVRVIKFKNSITNTMIEVDKMINKILWK